MAVKKILRIGDPNLLKRAEEMSDITTSVLHSVLEDLHDSMNYYGGVGIAAPRIGYFLRIVVFGFDQNERYPHEPAVPLTVLINPKIHRKKLIACWQG